MSDDVQVVFGANIAGLLRGVDEAKDSIESVKASVDRVADGAKHLAEILGVAFTVDKMVEFINRMSELGERTERTMATLGLTSEQAVQLGGVAKITGTDIDGMTQSLGRMALNVQRAVSDGFDPAAQGLKALGLGAREFIGVGTDQYLDKLHAAVARFNPSLNLTAAVMAVGGRGMVQMIPLLQTSQEKWEEMRNAIMRAQDGLAASIPRMAETNNKIGLLSLSAQSLGARLFTVLKPAIDQTVTALTNWLQSLDSEKIKGIVVTIGEVTLNVLQIVGSLAIQIMGWFDALGNSADNLKSRAAAAAGGATGGAVGGALVGGPVGAVAGAVGGGVLGYLFGGNGEKSPADKSEEARKKFEATIEKWRQSLREMASTLGGAGSAPGAHGSAGGQNVPALNFGGRDAHQAALSAVDAQVAAMRQGFERFKILREADANNFRISQGQKFALIAEELQRSVAAEISKYQAGVTWGNLTLKERQDLENKILQLKQRTATEVMKIEQRQFAAERSVISGYVGSIEQSWNSSLRGMLSGTMSFGQAGKKIMGDFAIYAIEQFQKKFVFEQLTTALATAFHIQGEGAKTAATVAGVSARTGAEQAGAATGMITMLGSVLKSIMASVGQVFAGASAFFAPFLGPGAPAAAAGVSAGVEGAALAMIPAFAEGTNMVTRSGFAMIHEKEAIVPARAAGAWRDGEMGPHAGGGDVHLHFKAWDGASVNRWLAAGGAAQIARAVKNHGAMSPGMG